MGKTAERAMMKELFSGVEHRQSELRLNDYQSPIVFSYRKLNLWLSGVLHVFYICSDSWQQETYLIRHLLHQLLNEWYLGTSVTFCIYDRFMSVLLTVLNQKLTSCFPQIPLIVPLICLHFVQRSMGNPTIILTILRENKLPIYDLDFPGAHWKDSWNSLTWFKLLKTYPIDGNPLLLSVRTPEQEDKAIRVLI